MDYFSHDVHHGKTITILQQRYGNDGYAFWFKLLELLGATENHTLPCGDSVEWAYVCSYCGVAPELGDEIMQTLVELRAIDLDLWEKERRVWCSKFVARLADVYDKRMSGTLPEKPQCAVSDSDNAGEIQFPTAETGFPVPEIPKVNESKPNKRKLFKPPTVFECIEYGKQLGMSEDESRRYFDNKETVGWTQGGSPMKDWKAGQRYWRSNGKKYGNSKPIPVDIPPRKIG